MSKCKYCGKESHGHPFCSACSKKFFNFTEKDRNVTVKNEKDRNVTDKNDRVAKEKNKPEDFNATKKYSSKNNLKLKNKSYSSGRAITPLQGFLSNIHSFRHDIDGNFNDEKIKENVEERAHEKVIVGLKERGGEDFYERLKYQKHLRGLALIESNPSYTENINLTDDKNRYDYEKHKLTLEHNERMFNKNIRNQNINDYINRKIAKKKYKDEKKAAKKRLKHESKVFKKLYKLEKKAKK